MTKELFIQKAVISMAGKVIGTDGTTNNHDWENMIEEAERLANLMQEKYLL